MEENKNTQIDAFLKKQIQEMPLESPSKDFTSNLMSVLEEETSQSTQYVPLISKKIWIGIAALIAAIFFIPFQEQEGSLMDKVPLDLSFLDSIKMPTLEGFTISSVALYAIFFFTLMIFAQIFYIKGYFNKRESGLL
ncbi:hypothetical protein [Pseudotenacibaculum haliotis]|uniref:DUF3379 domain-containing protein n=1 Tax=Pseudotenacibaculum haliotis TaxID=1862138 RepID=A0ABW5LNE4_9FLAO